MQRTQPALAVFEKPVGQVLITALKSSALNVGYRNAIIITGEKIGFDGFVLIQALAQQGIALGMIGRQFAQTKLTFTQHPQWKINRTSQRSNGRVLSIGSEHHDLFDERQMAGQRLQRAQQLGGANRNIDRLTQRQGEIAAIVEAGEHVGQRAGRLIPARRPEVTQLRQGLLTGQHLTHQGYGLVELERHAQGMTSRHLLHCAAGCAQHRRTIGQRFNRRQAETFVMRQTQAQASVLIEPGQLVITRCFQPEQLLTQRRMAFNPCQYGFVVPTRLANQHQGRPSLGRLPVQAVKQIKDEIVVLARLDRSHRQQEILRQADGCWLPWSGTVRQVGPQATDLAQRPPQSRLAEDAFQIACHRLGSTHPVIGVMHRSGEVLQKAPDRVGMGQFGE